MKAPSVLRQQLLLWALILGLWALLVVAFAGQLVFTSPRPLSWQQAFPLAFRDWLPWAFLAPVVAWLAARFPLERRNLTLNIPIHVVACMGAILVCQAVARLNHPQPGPAAAPPPGEPPYGLPGPPPTK